MQCGGRSEGGPRELELVSDEILNDESKKKRGFQANGNHDHSSSSPMVRDLVEAAHEAVLGFSFSARCRTEVIIATVLQLPDRGIPTALETEKLKN